VQAVLFYVLWAPYATAADVRPMFDLAADAGAIARRDLAERLAPEMKSVRDAHPQPGILARRRTTWKKVRGQGGRPGYG